MALNVAARARGGVDLLQPAESVAIRTANHNRIERLIHDFPALEAIAFNGATSAAIGRKLVGSATGIQLVDLPSSSPANTGPFVEKTAAWVVLKPLVSASNQVEIAADD